MKAELAAVDGPDTMLGVGPGAWYEMMRGWSVIEMGVGVLLQP